MLNWVGIGWWRFFVVIGAGLLLLGCAPTGPVKIGTLFAHSGDLGTGGPFLVKGANLAAEHINAAGGVLGRQVELVHRDSQTNPDAAIKAAQALVKVERVPAIVGCQSSGVTLKVANSVAIPGQVVLISPSSTSPALTNLQDNDFVFRTAPSDTLQGVVLAQLAKELGFKSAATMYINNAYGQGLSDTFEKEFTQLGGKVVATVAHESERETYASELRMALDGEPDVLVAISYPESATIFLKEAIEAKFAGRFLFVDGTKSPEMILRVGSQYLNGSFGTAPGAAETNAREAFREAYSWVYGEMPPRPFIGKAYDATVLIALAIQKAGKAEGPAIRDALRHVANPPGEKVGPGVEGIKKALQLLKDGKDIDYDGAAGPQNFDQFGDVVTLIEIWTIQEGKIETVRYEMPQ